MIASFIANWRDTGGSELANTQSFINGLTQLLGVEPPAGSKANDAHNDYVFERRVFQSNGDGTQSFGRIDCYKRDCFILEAKQGSEADRAAAMRGEDDLDLFGQTASTRVKRGTARRGTPGWARAMVQAKGQAERYARALPTDHGWPPFLLVVDVGYCIEVYADFTGTGRAYAQFPDRARYRIMLDDLHDEAVRDRLHAIWTDPKSLDPAARAARVTRDIADLLATVARRIEKRGHNAERTSGFLMRVLFTMFAEDSGLIPPGSFTGLLKSQRAHPQHLALQLEALWQVMDKGGFSPALGVPLKQFNGYLFKDRTAIDLDAEELDVLIQAAEHVWTEVEPAIFGTLLERALNPKERAKLGAHYTPRAYVERLIGPTIMEPLRADWDGVRGAAATLIEEGKADEARTTVQAFHARLAQTKVLDPACGTGNFLYVAMARMKELEGEVVALLEELGSTQYVAELTGHTITPENFLGIEINPRAAAIAQLVLWIGYLQWHFRVNGAERAPPEPILRDVRTIENRDALIDWDDRVLERDDSGAPVTIWDGISFKTHPVTGKLVPDEAGRLEIYRYIKPRATHWPKADFIVGNPPFIGNKRMRERLGEGYTEAVRKAFPKVGGSVDFVMYWWAIAAARVGEKSARRFGFITTNSITQTFNRSVIATAPCKLMFAIADHPWVDGNDGAAVRIAMTVGAGTEADGVVLLLHDEQPLPDGYGEVGFRVEEKRGHINIDLSIGVDPTRSKALKSNEKIAFTGMYPLGDGFIIAQAKAAELSRVEGGSSYLKQFFTASDLTRKPRGAYIIDFYPLSEKEALLSSPDLYQHLVLNVKPERAVNPVEERRKNWWLFTRPIPDLRKAVANAVRFIAIPRTAKYFTFQFVPAAAIVDTTVVAIAAEDAFVLGVLSSHTHVCWALRTGGTLEDRPRYQHESTFKPFPFPADVPEPLKARIRAEAEALDALRKRVLAAHDDLTLTKLYNVLEALKAGRALSAAERDIHDRGLVTLIRQHHDAIDAAVAQAYGWPETLDDEAIITRLVALNKARAAEEARGHVRWLRPEFQAPNYQPPAEQGLDLGDAPAAVPSNIIPWPATLPEQVSAVQSILAAAPAPLAVGDVARAFKGKRPASLRPVLDALAGIGMARRLADGRYAA
jgi:hypothetical protein